MIGAEGQNRTDDTRLFRAVLYRLSYLGADRRWCQVSTPRVSASGGRKDTDAPDGSQPQPIGLPRSATPICPAMPSRALMRSPIGGWVSHSDFARSSKLLIGLTM